MVGLVRVQSKLVRRFSEFSTSNLCMYAMVKEVHKYCPREWQLLCLIAQLVMEMYGVIKIEFEEMHSISKYSSKWWQFVYDDHNTIQNNRLIF